jgi:hypothetical protein
LKAVGMGVRDWALAGYIIEQLLIDEFSKHAK